MQIYTSGKGKCYMEKDLKLEDLAAAFGDKKVWQFTEKDLDKLKEIQGAEELVEGVERYGFVMFTEDIS